MTPYDVAIIGAGPAGMTAAIYAVRANMSVLMLDKLAPGGQMINTNEIENYPCAGKINGAELGIQMFEHTQSLGVAYEDKTIIEIQDRGEIKALICQEDDTILARSVIIATGTQPRRLGIPGEERFAGNGLSWCAICDGTQYRGKDVVVIGGGNSAVEESIYLAGICNSLSLVTLFDLTADPKACVQLKKQSNVTIYPFQDILEFTGETALEGIRFKGTQDGKETLVPCNGAFEYIGLTPNSGFIEALGICNDQGFIDATDEMKTRVTGIFGAGDIVSKKLRQVVTACNDGAIAANSAAKYIESIRD